VCAVPCNTLRLVSAIKYGMERMESNDQNNNRQLFKDCKTFG